MSRERPPEAQNQVTGPATDTIILTKRLLLRPLELRDAETVVAWRNDPRNAELFLSPPPTLEEHLAWFATERPNRVDYIITLRETGELIGTLNYARSDQRGLAETGTLIGARQHRGKGIATEAKVVWTLFGFAMLNIDTIEVRIREDNAAMLHIDRKLGYEEAGSAVMKNAHGDPYTYRVLRLRRKRVLELPAYEQPEYGSFLTAIRAKENALR